MTRRALAWIARALGALLLAAAPAAAQEPAAGGPPELLVPSDAPPVVDGRIGDGEWKGAASFPLEQSGHAFGSVRVLRSGRQLYVALDGRISAWGIGVRLEVTDPVSGRSNLVLITPLGIPRSPIAPYRKLVERDAERLSPAACDIRFSFAAEAFTFELRVPLDLLEIGATDKEYQFTFSLWAMAEDRAIVVWPLDARAVTADPLPAVLKSEGAWGAAEPAVPAPPGNDGLLLLDDAGKPAETGPMFPVMAGWVDGRRKDAALAAFEERAARVAAASPDLLSVRLLLVQARLARNDFAGALRALDEMEAYLPALAGTGPQILVRMQLLRDVGRFEDALAALAVRAQDLEGNAVAARERVVLEGMRDAWRMEQEVRKAEAKRDDLPRALLKTTKGEIEVELFEDDAGNGVANFIALVESGFYDGTRFHWADGGGRVIGGDPNSRNDDPHDDGFGDPGYLLESEPGRRMIFPMTLSYADKRRERRTEGCVFVIHLAPAPDEDGVNTVFGRVVKGEDVVRKLEYRDTIEKASILRKRPHPYTPVRRVLGTG